MKNGNKKTTIKKIPKKISVYEKQSVTITRGGVGNCKEELTGKTCWLTNGQLLTDTDTGDHYYGDNPLIHLLTQEMLK